MFIHDSRTPVGPSVRSANIGSDNRRVHLKAALLRLLTSEITSFSRDARLLKQVGFSADFEARRIIMCALS